MEQELALFLPRQFHTRWYRLGHSDTNFFTVLAASINHVLAPPLGFPLLFIQNLVQFTYSTFLLTPTPYF